MQENNQEMNIPRVQHEREQCMSASVPTCRTSNLPEVHKDFCLRWRGQCLREAPPDPPTTPTCCLCEVAHGNQDKTH